MARLPVDQGCCCPGILGGECEDLTIGVAEAYWTCAANLDLINYIADADACDDRSEIADFSLKEQTPGSPLPEELLQPLLFYKEDDFSGLQSILTSNLEGGASNANVATTIKVVANSPKQESILRKNKGREIALVVRLRNGRWKVIGQTGGLRLSEYIIDSSLFYVQMTISGQPSEEPRFLSFTDNGAWADANIIPGGLVRS